MKEQQASPLSVLETMGRRDFINVISSETDYCFEDKMRTDHCFIEEAETLFCE